MRTSCWVHHTAPVATVLTLLPHASFVLAPDATMQNIHGSRSPLLIVAFEEHKTPIVFTSAGERTARVRHANATLLSVAAPPNLPFVDLVWRSGAKQPSKRRPGVSLPGSVAKLLRETPLRKFTPDERSIIWRHRDALVHVPGVRAALDTRAARAATRVSYAFVLLRHSSGVAQVAPVCELGEP